MTARPTQAKCKTCEALPVRPKVPVSGVEYRPVKPRRAPHPGPRCTTHHRQARAARSVARKAVHVEKTYSITEEQYQKLLAAQGGGCFICGRKPGRRRLSVDHDHSCCSGKTSCGKCVRMLACNTCNKYMGYVRDSPEAFERGAEGLRNPPARLVLGIY